jgi:hypothetical protein
MVGLPWRGTLGISNIEQGTAECNRKVLRHLT